jgi:methionine--tRNA ligase beta chain
LSDPRSPQGGGGRDASSVSPTDVARLAVLARVGVAPEEAAAIAADLSNALDRFSRLAAAPGAAPREDARPPARADVSAPFSPSLTPAGGWFHVPVEVPATGSGGAPSGAHPHPAGRAPALSPSPRESMDTQQETRPLISIDDFAKVDLRTGRIVSAEKHPKADRLVVLQVDVGEEKPRQIVAGIAVYYPDFATLVGRTIIVVCNLQPAELRGVRSEGMLLAAGGKDHQGLLTVPGDCIPGSLVR